MKPRGPRLAVALFVALTLVLVLVATARTAAQPADAEAAAPPSLRTPIVAIEHAQQQQNLARWYEAVHAAEVKRFLDADHAAKVRAAAAEKARRARLARSTTVHAAAAPVVPEGPMLARDWDSACGGDLPPCFVLQRESHGGDLRVYNGGCYYPSGYDGDNPCGSTASGKWQFLRSTWADYCFEGKCYHNAADAPAAAQNAKAREVWAHGCGASHWGLDRRSYGC